MPVCNCTYNHLVYMCIFKNIYSHSNYINSFLENCVTSALKLNWHVDSLEIKITFHTCTTLLISPSNRRSHIE